MYANRANLAAVDHLSQKLPDFNECPPTKYNGPPKSLHPFTINRERGII